jgi:hypothetical protein
MQLRKNRLWAAIWKQRAESYLSANALLQGKGRMDLTRLPPGPVVAELYRVSATFRDALSRWQVMAPLSEEKAASQGVPITQREERVLRRQLADRLIRGLEVGGFEAAQSELISWVSEAVESQVRETNMTKGTTTAVAIDNWLHRSEVPGVRVVIDAHDVLLPLMDAFRDPAHFFQDNAPRVDPFFLPVPWFERAMKDPAIGEDLRSRFRGPCLDGMIGVMKRTNMMICPLVARTLHVWGPGALMNRQLREVFDALTPREKAFVLAAADARPPYADGRAKGRKDSKPRPKRVDAAREEREIYRRAREMEDETGDPWGSVSRAIDERAKREGKKPATIKRRIFPRRPKK